MDSIVSYLSSFTVFLSAAAESDDETADAGTKKPVAKGRKMYRSEKISLCEVSDTPTETGTLLFRANVEASMRKQLCRHPQVVLHKMGHVESAQCDCEASSDGRCSHVACLLYLIEDLSFGASPKISVACTSKAQAWGKGAARKRDPQPVHSNR
jgi:hypothetical protein